MPEPKNALHKNERRPEGRRAKHHRAKEEETLDAGGEKRTSTKKPESQKPSGLINMFVSGAEHQGMGRYYLSVRTARKYFINYFISHRLFALWLDNL